MEELKKEVENLKKEVSDLKQRRVYQSDVIPQSIKNRAQGEPNTYVFSGLSANKPTRGVKLTTTGLGCSIWWSYDTNVLSIWNGTSWVSETFT